MDFWLFFVWYPPYSATYQSYGKFSKEYNGDIYFLLWAMHLKEIAKNLIIEQHLYEYKKGPLERFTFLQISSELIIAHHWMVELGSVIKVKPAVTRGPLCKTEWLKTTLNESTDSLASFELFNLAAFEIGFWNHLRILLSFLPSQPHSWFSLVTR